MWRATLPLVALLVSVAAPRDAAAGRVAWRLWRMPVMCSSFGGGMPVLAESQTSLIVVDRANAAEVLAGCRTRVSWKTHRLVYVDVIGSKDWLKRIRSVTTKDNKILVEVEIVPICPTASYAGQVGGPVWIRIPRGSAPVEAVLVRPEPPPPPCERRRPTGG